MEEILGATDDTVAVADAVTEQVRNDTELTAAIAYRLFEDELREEKQKNDKFRRELGQTKAASEKQLEQTSDDFKIRNKALQELFIKVCEWRFDLSKRTSLKRSIVSRAAPWRSRGGEGEEAERSLRGREKEAQQLRQHLEETRAENELAQTCLRYHQATTGLDTALSEVMEALRSAVSPTQWNLLPFAYGSQDEVITAERINLVGALYSHVHNVDRASIRRFFDRWVPWRNRFAHRTMVRMPPAEDMRFLEESEGVLDKTTQLVSLCKAGQIPRSDLEHCFYGNRVFWGNR